MLTKTTDLRHKVKRAIDGLSRKRLKAVADFVRYLEYLESEEATQEILSIPGAAEEIQQGLKDVAAGRTTPVENLKRKHGHVRRRAG